MTQYHSEKPLTTAVDPVDPPKVRDQNVLEKKINNLTERVQQQDEELRELQRLLKKLQNEVRTAINAFNLKNRG
jgi:CRISPR/Cas system-associated protein Cas10 (large subunit of type III CRISPR-Cas system)